MTAYEKVLTNIKHLRAFMVINDLPYWRQLQQYKVQFRKYGIKKKVWQGVAYDDILNHDVQNIPWLDKEVSAEEIKAKPLFSQFSPHVQAEILRWKDRGFMIVPGFFDPQRTDELRQSVEGCLSDKEREKYRRDRIQDLWSRNEQVDGFFRDPELLKLLSFVLGRQVVPFQTINFYKGTEQKPHSDSIHFATEPFGYMIAAWVALEDIAEGSGELLYYPGSHQFPFVSNRHYEHGNTRWKINVSHYLNYEKRIGEIIAEKGIKPQTFAAKKGDILIWHANLLHGGSPIKAKNATRQSLVMHYYGKDVLSYCERVEKLAILTRLKKHFTC